MKKDTMTLEKAKKLPAGGVLVGKREGQTMIYDDATVGGYFVGKLHKEGGIKGINKSTGQPIEVQGSEVIITAPAVADQTKREFQGEMLTNREILSKINVSGGGVSFEHGGDIPKELYYNGSSYNFGGKTMTDYEILQSMNDCGCEHEYNNGGGLSKGKSLEDIAKMHNVSVSHIKKQLAKGKKVESEHTSDKKLQEKIAKDHLVENPNYYTILDKVGLKNGGNITTYKNKYNKKYGYPLNESHDLEQISKDTGFSIKGLQQIYNKGIGAYKTNPESVRPSVTSKEQWAMARVYSAVMGGKASKVDSNELKMNSGGKLDLVKESKKGDHPARDFSNYTDVVDVAVDGVVGSNTGIAFNDGGSVNTPTRFWGSKAGGVLVYCSSTERYLLLLRSPYVLEPRTWGIISGKLDEGESSIEEAVLREVEEETGQKIDNLIPSYVFKAPNFTFHNFISIVEDEFEPILNWENTDYKWVKLEDFPKNLHFGVKILKEQEDLTALVKRESVDLDFLDEMVQKFDDGGSTKELVDYIEIWSAGSSLSNLYGRKYENYKDLKKDLEEINPRYSYIYLAPNGKSMGSAIDVKKDGKNTVKTINPTTSKAKDFEKAIKRSWGEWRYEKYDLSNWLKDDGKRTPKPKPQPQPEPTKEKAYVIRCSLYDNTTDILIDKPSFYYVDSLYNFLKGAKKSNSRDLKVVIDIENPNNIFIGSNTFYLKQENEDFKSFNIEQISIDIFKRLFVNYFPDLDLSELFVGEKVERLSLSEKTDIFSKNPLPPQPIKEQTRIDFEATRKYLTLRIADLTRELNFKKPRLSNEEVGFYQRDINDLIFKLRKINEKELDTLPIKDRLEGAYSLKWGDINAEYKPSNDLLAPNGLPTKLTDNEWVNVRSDYFSSFFGDWRLANEIGDFSGVSKVIDPETKEPMPVYHGTNVLFTEWKTYKTNNAHYFAKNRDFSQWFAEQWSKGRGDISAKDSNLLKQLNPNKGEYVYRCFLDIKNPIDFSRFGVEKRPVSDFLLFLQINYNIGDFDFWTNFRLFNNLAQDTLVYSWMIIRNWQSFTEYIKMATTHDGYIFYEYHPEKVGTGLDGASLSFCAFDSSQIKFTTATEFNALITDSRFEQGGKL